MFLRIDKCLCGGLFKNDNDKDVIIDDTTSKKDEIGDQLFEFYAIPSKENLRASFDYRAHALDASYHYESWDFDPPDIATTKEMRSVAFEIIMHTLEPFVAKKTLASFVKAVIEKYVDSHNSYHGLEHALHVFHTMHMLMKSGLAAILGDEHLRLTCYLAALCHDLDHPGLTNRFLVATDDAIAVRSNYVSPLEMHHVAVAFSLLSQPCNNIFAGIDLKHLYEFKRTFARLVLSTDIAEHVHILDKFGTNHKDPLTLAKMAIKCCDLSHTFSSYQNHLLWVQRLEDEFFVQGDRERLLGLPVTPFFERAANGIHRTQNTFFRTIVLPMFREFVVVVPGAAEMLSRVEENHREWDRMSGERSHNIAAPKCGGITDAHMPHSK